MNRHSHWLVEQFRSGLTREQAAAAFQDLQSGLQRYQLWAVLGLYEIKQRYRRSRIGPLWITLSMGIFIGALGLLYGAILGQPLSEYMPYLAAGFLVWTFISSAVVEGAEVFLNAGGVIKQLNAPLSTYVYRLVWGNLIIFLHNLLIFITLALWFQVEVGLPTLFVIPGLMLLAINAVWIGLLLGLLSARFRDIPLMLKSGIQLIFFITPVIWSPDMLPGRPLLLTANPFYHMVEIVRAPLLGVMPSIASLMIVVAIAVIGCAMSLLFYSVYRWRIAYWV
ncbi:MAG: ABC transporter permease [Halochromatium sp.]|nr:ABC transporter permease [Halochromatium sp.]